MQQPHVMQVWKFSPSPHSSSCSFAITPQLNQPKTETADKIFWRWPQNNTDKDSFRNAASSMGDAPVRRGIHPQCGGTFCSNSLCLCHTEHTWKTRRKTVEGCCIGREKLRWLSCKLCWFQRGRGFNLWRFRCVVWKFGAYIKARWPPPVWTLVKCCEITSVSSAIGGF